MTGGRYDDQDAVGVHQVKNGVGDGNPEQGCFHRGCNDAGSSRIVHHVRRFPSKDRNDKNRPVTGRHHVELNGFSETDC